MKTTKRDMPHKGQACEQSHQAIATQAGLTPEPAGFDAAANADTGRAALPAGLDPELLNLYIAEALDHIDKAEGALLSIERDPGNAELLDTVFRAFHTIKGTSGMLELEPVQRLAHLAENLLDRARDHEIPLTGANADLALASCDALKVMVKGLEGVGPGDPVPVPEGYASLLDRLGSQAAAGSSAQADLDADKLLQGGNVSPEKDESGPAASLAEGTENTLRPQGACGHGSTDSAVRVSTERLDKLINMVGELVISHSVTAQDAGRAKGDAAGLERNVRRTAKIVRELQNLTLVLCMVSLKATFQRMARLVRDLGRRNGKPIRLVTEGEGTEIDRNMVESLGDPLVHMIRNAIDHGIESADERRKAGKDETGTLCLRARYSGGGVVIELSDDGRGLDREKILANAIERGLARPDVTLSDSEVYALAFQAGVSTSETVTDISGRGVGLDVVRKCAETLQGVVEVTSQPGRGATFALRLPLTLAITDAILLRVGAERYLLPTVNILESLRPDPGTVWTLAHRGEMIMLRGESVPVFRLHELFDIQGAKTDPCDGLLIVVEANGTRCAVLVDEVLGQQQVVVKSLGRALGQVDGVSGGAILGDGRVGLILDAGGIRKLAEARIDRPKVEEPVGAAG